jgi:fatty acid desaturase
VTALSLETTESAPALDFGALATRIRAEGHLDRRLCYYWIKIGLTVAAYAVGWLAFFVVGNSWASLGVAVLLGVSSTQLGFLAHDAGHGQIFASRYANRMLGFALGNGLIGLSFGWWVPKHSAHHAHPNQANRDPDMGVGLVHPLTRWQAQLFLPLMLLRSTGLYTLSAKDLFRRADRGAVSECLLLALRTALYLAAVLWVLPIPKAVAFIAIYEATFSFYLGCSFAPNHKGMPVLDTDSTMSFARRQIVTARNVTGGRWTGFILGGLNYQIEHHLFPTMPRPSLRRAQHLVREFCAENALGYCEEPPVRSYWRAMRGCSCAGVDTRPAQLRRPSGTRG